MRRRLASAVIIFALVFPYYSCASAKQNPRHAATVAAVSVYTALAAIQDQEAEWFKTQQPFTVTQQDHQAFNAKLVVALKAGKAFDDAILAWPAGTPAPGDLPGLVKDLSASLNALAEGLPNEQMRLAVQSGVVSVANIVMTVLALTASRT